MKKQSKCKINIVRLGHMKRLIDFKSIKKMKSDIITIDGMEDKSCIPDTYDQETQWQYLSDSIVNNCVRHTGDADFTVAITEYALEDNFYMRRVSEKVTIISLYDVGDFLQYHNIPIENFIKINIYKMVALFKIYRKIPLTSDGIPEIIHDETRSCLFDMNGLKTDVIY